MKTFYLTILSLFISFLSISQTVSTTINYTGFLACGGCAVCGGDYYCFDDKNDGFPAACNNTGTSATKNFNDPVPAGNLVTNITVQYYSADCSGYSMSGTVDGNTVPTVNDGNKGCLCSSNPCGITGSSSANYPCGMPGYVYGGVNTLKLTCNGVLCINKIILTITYTSPILINPVITPSGPTTFCAGGSVVLDAGSGYLAYKWNTGATTRTITVTTSGTYTVTVTSSTGCTSGNASATVTVNPAPSVSASASPASICPGGSAVLNGSGASTYTWQPGGLSGAAVSVSPASTQIYTVTGTTSGCTNTATTTVTVGSPVVAINPPSATICAGGSVGLTASGTTSYSWNTGANTATITVSPTVTTTYTVTGTTGSCTSPPKTAVVTVNPAPTVSTSASPSATICQGQSTTISATGGGTYSWSSGGTTSSITVSPTTTTTYSVTVTTALGCSNASAPATEVVTVNAAPTVSTSASPSATICQGQSTTISATGGGTYSWSNGKTTSSVSVSPTTTTTYSVTVTTASGCSNASAPATQVVTVNPLPTVVTSASPSATICQGQSATVSATGGGTYSWSNGKTTSSITVSPTTTTTYSVTVTTASGCSNASAPATQVVTVNPTPSVTINASPSSTICAGNSAVLTANGGGTYSWSTGATTSSITVSPTVPTTYSVTVTTASGCSNASAPATITINVNSTPAVSVAALPSTTICSGHPDTLSASGATTYSWSNGKTTSSIIVSPSTTTTYSVTGTISGCSNSSSPTTVVVNVNPTPTVSITASPSATICQGQSAILSTSATGGYSWNTGATTDSITVNPSTTTTYSLIFTTSLGCSNSSSPATLVVKVNATPTVSVKSSGSATVCSGKADTLTASGASSYIWMPGGSTSSVISVIPDSTINFMVIGANGAGCADTINYTLNVIITPTISISVSGLGGSDTLCEGQSVTLTANGNGGTVTYTWNNGATTSSITVSPGSTTTYSLVAANGGCVDSGLAQVINVYPPLTLSMQNDSSCVGKTATVNVKVTGGEQTYNYVWSNGTTGVSSIVVTANSTATYTCTVTDGCKATVSDSSIVMTFPPTSVSFTATPKTIPGGQFISFVNTTVGATTFYWTFGNGATSSAANPYVQYLDSGSYIVTLIASNTGCADTLSDTVFVTEAMFIPNVFTPNGDGVNDVFHITMTSMKVYNIEIFDRWGQRVFETDSPYTDWDGRSQGGIMESDGTYYYLITSTDYSGKSYKFNGYVQLIGSGN